ncbi:Campylobacter invasion antigen B (CiaB) [hydrothermal vent metagenome]|uniref:Campylobacter invasion antigen B (CiaB) n=1 Tax=hydrothermal vent metagenome TaxID=652676 RepID=A0A1W1E9M0_9ZZZZ
MTKQQFMNDLQAVYLELQSRQAELNGYYDLLEEGKSHAKADEVVDAFLKLLEIPRNKESEMAALTRIVNLREDALEQVLQKEGADEERIRLKKELAYGFVSMLHIARHESFIGWIEQQKLLTPFYRSLIFGVHFVGLRMSEWQSHWTHHIINTVNPELSAMFNGDDAKVFEMLQSQALLDVTEEGCVGDRCYSVLVKDEEQQKYQAVAYAEAFEKEVEAVVVALEQLIALLNQHEDEVFGQKQAWIAYFTALKEAFGHKKTDELIAMWAEVDRRWMAITTPLQVGHPLEYYEDHYRKAVALEWDLRIVNPKLQENSHTRKNIKLFAYEMAQKFGESAEHTIAKNLLQVDRTQLYIGQPMLYYAAEFNGLFSAQVVPNDEQVSTELGKKIFAYADFVLQSKIAKPVMRLSVEVMGEDFVRKQRMLAQSEPELWHKLYDISTIGHEYGHILWIDSDTETVMNASGQFKNIEEFKATVGGLMAFFHHEEEALKHHIVDDLVSRAVGLMAWREVGEVLPYYCEGLIHLEILFASGIIGYEEQITIDYGRYEAMKETYTRAYEALARHYLKKEDALAYLERYASKENGVYLPVTTEVKAFVEHYYRRYKEIGQQTVSLD